jgi:predicted nucleotidyltransferase
MTVAHPRLPASLEDIEAFCRKWQVQEFALFGSIVRDDFRPDSDIDVMVQFEPDARRRPWGGYADMQSELEEMFGRSVDLVEKSAVINPYRVASIRKDLTVIYAARRG